MHLPNLRRWRHRRALTQRELARAAGIGTTTLNRIEQGLQTARPGTARKLATALGIDPAALIEDGPAPGSSQPEPAEAGR